jgi:hypothetical protein
MTTRPKSKTPSLFAAAGLDSGAPRPLADKLRPDKLADVVGQDHLLGPDGILTRMLVALARLAHLWSSRHRQDHGGAVVAQATICISSKSRRSFPASAI